MYKISDFAKVTRLSKDTLRYYADIKLLEPAYIDPKNNYRYYDDGSYFLAILLVKLRKIGFTIQEMTQVMEDESFQHLEELVKQKRANVISEIERLQHTLVEMDEFLASGKESNHD